MKSPRDSKVDPTLREGSAPSSRPQGPRPIEAEGNPKGGTAAIDVQTAIKIDLAAAEGGRTVWVHTHGMDKYGKPELEIRSVPAMLVKGAAILLNDVASYMLNTREIRLGRAGYEAGGDDMDDYIEKLVDDGLVIRMPRAPDQKLEVYEVSAKGAAVYQQAVKDGD